MTTVDEDVEDTQVVLPSPAVHIAPAVAPTTSQWRRDARVLGSRPLHALGSLGPSLGAKPTLVREYLLVTSGSKEAVSPGCQPEIRVVSFFAWTVLGSPPFCSVHRCKVAGGH